MAGFTRSIEAFNRIDLSNYYPQRKSNNCVVFIHKKYIAGHVKTDKKDETSCNPQSQTTQEHIEEEIDKKNNKSHSHDLKRQVSKGVQDAMHPHGLLDKLSYTKIGSTVQGQKILPLILPTSGTSSPILYTVKKKNKTKGKEKVRKSKICDNDSLAEIHETIFEEITNKRRKVNEDSNKNKNKLHINLSSGDSEGASIEHNTISDIQLTKSLSCSISEASTNKYCDNDTRIVKDKNKFQKIQPQSFDVSASEVGKGTGETKTNVVFMSDKEKSVLIENIQCSVINAMKKCFKETKENSDDKNEIKITQRLIKTNTLKLNKIYEKLSELENRICSNIKQNNCLPSQLSQRSKLEELSEDREEVDEINRELNSHFIHDNIDRVQKVDDKAAVIIFSPKRKERSEKSARGEEVSNLMSINSTKVIRPECVKRIPTRFCWTDASQVKLSNRRRRN